ncbi:MAG TPA: DinB family protein [Longimicrobiales bacterium]|nr:DinB family protein [Longimicrobiales bacterium]
MGTTTDSPGQPASSPGTGAPRAPSTLPDIAARIGEVRDEIGAYVGGLAADDLFHRVPGVWAPIDDLRHLVRVNAALAKGLGLPGWMLRLRFGRPARGAWSYARLTTLYDALLSTGAKAPTAYVPPQGLVADRDAYRARTLERWRGVNEQLLRRVEQLSERGADRAALPHPGLGLLSLREMLFFTIHHDLHHLAVARRRVADRAAVGEEPAPSPLPKARNRVDL